MWHNLPVLSILIWLPVLGAVIVLLFSDQKALWARLISLAVSIISLILCGMMYSAFDVSTPAMQFTEHLTWIPAYDVNYNLGVDGIAMPLILLTTFTTLLVVLSSWTVVKFKISQYLAAFLVMQGMIVGVFAATDAILFYLFWEAVLIPMYLSIGIWGGENRSYAAIKFFIYTFLGSALLLVGLIYLRFQSGSFDIASFYAVRIGLSVQIAIFFLFLLAFAIKIPMWPLHTWLPDAHTEAPAGGSVILAALMLKMGAYGFLRFSLPIVPDACRALDWFMIILSLIAIVYVGLIAFAQTDLKRLIAYSSVAHMGFVTLGCFMVYLIVTRQGDIHAAYMSLEGAMVQMISHAFGSGAMFLAFGILYHQMHTRLIKDFGGIAKTMPVFASFFMLYVMSNVGLPGTSSFVGEFMIIVSSFKVSFWVTFLAASTLIVGAIYTLWMYKRVFFGSVVNKAVAELKEVSALDRLTFVLLAVVIIAIGVYPNWLLNVFHASVGNLLHLSLQSKL